MPTETIYYFHQQPMTYQQAQDFLVRYRRSIRRSFDRYTRILPHIPLHSHVLDFGCGWGVFTEMVHLERQCQIDGIDLDPASIQIARDLVQEKQGLSFSVRHIKEILDETYDVVISTQVAEHTLNPGNYLCECNRVLRPGGYLIISVPNILTPRQFLSILSPTAREKFQAISKMSENQHVRTRDHVQAWDPLTFCRLLSTLGFEYDNHEFMEGVALPLGKYWRRPWGLFKNWSYTMLFKMHKVKFIAAASDD